MDTQPLSNYAKHRRRLLVATAALGVGAVLPGCQTMNGGTGSSSSGSSSGGKKNVDQEIFNFALNLEFLEAEYYSRGAYGRPLEDWDVELGSNPGEVRGGNPVNFSNPAFREFAEELAANEVAHVRYYRQTLGRAAVARPAIDFVGGFSKAAQAAGLVAPGETFDAFANEVNFFLGGMLFEDVGVTAYNGAIPLITSKKFLQAAAGILGVEAYHMGMARSLLYQHGEQARTAANMVSDARDKLGGPEDKDQGIAVDRRTALPIIPRGAKGEGASEHANVVPSDNDAICFHRTPRQVLNIVYLKPGATQGGFYPSGFNGDLSALL